jgi:anaerobic magnesium-protoporphyrin IX monomethyl ester cyclase
MKIVFIEPRATEANVYSRMSMPLLGPVYLGTILKNRGHDVEVYNEDMSRLDFDKLGNADVIGISILTSTASRGYEIARKFPREKVIIGGVHASLLPEESLQYCRQVVKGEAEEVIADVVEGRISDPIVAGRPVRSLDSLPFPDFSLIKGYSPNPIIMPISTSRGCPFDCSFCSVTKVFGREYRFRSPGNIMEEIGTRKARSLFFCDDNFTAFPARTRSLLDMMLKTSVPAWSCQVRCDAAKDPGLLKMMSRAGCRLACIGLESVSPETLKAYKKAQTREDIVSAIKTFHKNKIKVHGMFVLGAEQDGIHTVWQTLKFALKEKLDTIQMSILTPFPGTKVHEELSSQNRIFTTDWRLYDGQHIVFNPKLLSARELQMTVVKAYKKFYSLSRLFRLLSGLRLRNAMFCFMGRSIIREWIRRNRALAWLA